MMLSATLTAVAGVKHELVDPLVSVLVVHQSVSISLRTY
jgi:hypothetical protein